MNSRHLRRAVHRMTMQERRRNKTIRRNRADRERNERLRAENEAAIRANPDRYLKTIRVSDEDLHLARFGNDPHGIAPRYDFPQGGEQWEIKP